MGNESLDELIDRYGSGNVKKALWLQDEIKKDGIDGIRFMGKAEDRVSQYAHLIVYQSVRSKMKHHL